MKEMKILIKHEKDRHLAALDTIKIFVALLIIMWHYAGYGGEGVPGIWSFPVAYFQLPFPYPANELTQFMILGDTSAIGVQFFFVLSGFIFMCVYKERIAENKINLQEFCVLCFSRLYPLVWLTTTLMVIMNLIKYSYGGNLGFDLYTLITNFLLIPYYVIDLEHTGINVPIWTLSLEIVCYLLFFFIASKSKRKNGILLFAIPVYFGAVFLRLNIDVPILYFNFARSFLGFFSGCYLYELYKWSQMNKRRSLILGVVSLLVSIISVISWFIIGFDFTNSHNPHFTYSVLIFPAFILSVLNIPFLNKFLSLRPFLWFSKFSFSFYLYHWLILYAISELNSFGIINFNSSSLTSLFIFFAILLLISYLSYNLFELPIQRWIRNKYFQNKNRL